MRFKILVLVAFFTSVFAQQFQTEDEKIKSILQNESMSDSKELQKYYQNIFSTEKGKSSVFGSSYQVNKEQLLENMKKAIPLDGPVNPNQYMVGPNDVLSIDIWGEIPFNYSAPVSPEGTLIVPSIGIIDVGNKTLSDVKQSVEEQLRTKFLEGDITVSLVMPRIFNVYVGGLVNYPGTFYASSVHRVDHALYLANLESAQTVSKISQETNLNRDKNNREEAISYIDDTELRQDDQIISLRNIKVIRNNNDTLIVDLMRFYATGDVRFNPYLNDGDRIIVQNTNLKRNTVAISGAVRLSGEFEYSPHDSVSAMFELCQGATQIADLSNVDFYRLDKGTGNYKHQVINVKEILNGTMNDFPLIPGDRFIVGEIERESYTSTVNLKGEVNKPGIYPIKRGKTTLSELINMAGGFTKYASLNEAKIIRFPDQLDHAYDNPDYRRMAEMRLGDVDEWDRKYFNFEASIKRNFVSANFAKIFVEKDPLYDVVLEHQDIILIPAKQNTIYVFGQVPNPGYLKYIPGYEVADYINLAGGYSDMAQEGDLTVIKAGSKNWVSPDDTVLEAGDAIFVPRERDSDWEYFFGWFSKIVTTLGGIATVILLLTK